MKKAVLVILVLVGVVAIAGGVAVWRMGLGGTSSLEKWIGSSLQAVTNSYINPQLAFDDLDYEYPLTVKVKNLRLTCPYPGQADKTVDIAGAKSAVITLAEMPRQGKPIVISAIDLDEPTFQAISESPGSTRLIGWSQVVRDGVIKDNPTTQDVKKKLSDVLQMRRIKLNNGRVVYDPRIEGTQPMVLDQISTELLIAPATGGSYDVKLGLNRKPLFTLDASTRLDLDTFSLTNTAVRLNGMVGQEQQSYLPPQLQEILRKYQVEGKLSVDLTGDVLLQNLKQSKAAVTVVLTQANITTDEYHVPISKLSFESQMQDGKVCVSSLTVKALKGTLEANGLIALNRRLDSDLHLDINDMVIDELFVKPGTAENPKLAGRVKANINATVPIGAMVVRLAPETMASTRFAERAPELLEPLPEKWGAGQIHLDHGRLVNVPVLEQLTRAITKTARLITRKRGAIANEKADVNFDFMGDQIKISEFTYAGEFVAARGTGEIALDQRLNLLVNAGPIEKLKTLLGTQIGAIINFVTPELVTYKVTGTVDEPKVSMMLGSGTTQEIVTDAGEAAAHGVGKVGKAIGRGAKGILDGLFGN